MSLSSVSIITINFNNADGIEKTIRSVKSQEYTSIQHLVIDGGSKDGSQKIVVKHSSDLHYWVSEPDSGIYHAMNKGIQAATGDYLLFLNSGDQFYDETALARLINGNSSEALIYGNLKLVGPHYQGVKKYSNKLTFYDLCAQSLPHPATLIRRDVFDVVGLYDETNKIVSDWAFFMLAIFKHNLNYKHVDEVISIFYLDGMSHDVKNVLTTNLEREQFLQANFRNLMNDYAALEQYETLKNNLLTSRSIRLLKKLGFFSYLN